MHERVIPSIKSNSMVSKLWRLWSPQKMIFFKKVLHSLCKVWLSLPVSLWFHFVWAIWESLEDTLVDRLPVYPLLTVACLVFLCNTLFSDFSFFLTTTKYLLFFYCKRVIIPVLLKCFKCYLVVCLIIPHCVNFNTFVGYLVAKSVASRAQAGNTKGWGFWEWNQREWWWCQPNLCPSEDASQTRALLKDQPTHVQKVELFLGDIWL